MLVIYVVVVTWSKVIAPQPDQADITLVTLSLICVPATWICTRWSCPNLTNLSIAWLTLHKARHRCTHAQTSSPVYYIATAAITAGPGWPLTFTFNPAVVAPLVTTSHHVTYTDCFLFCFLGLFPFQGPLWIFYKWSPSFGHWCLEFFLVYFHAVLCQHPSFPHLFFCDTVWQFAGPGSYLPINRKTYWSPSLQCYVMVT